VRGQFFCFARKKISLVVILATCCLYIVGKTTMEAAMFGNKHNKQQRLQRMADVIGQHPSGISQSALARKIGVPRCTVKRDLPTLEQRGILLSEDPRGWVSLFRRRW
jgi:biotin operon repressor